LITIDDIRRRAESDARSNGCYLNTNSELLNDLLEGLKCNVERYGYSSCPCRLASGNFTHDRDIICPCDYRDIDVREFGSCYCGLYTSKDIFEGVTSIQQVPERRSVEKQVRAFNTSEETIETAPSTPNDVRKITLKLWFCKQCGYVCFRDVPPYICPICKAKKERFAPLLATN
jgi:ferredoxin-thioredoxin reductase catalytic subunit